MREAGRGISCDLARNPIYQYIDDSGICPVCKIVMGSRLQVIRHASEKRSRGSSKLTCRHVIESGSVPLVPSAALSVLEKRDAELKRSSRRAGHSTVLIASRAKRWHNDDFKVILEAWRPQPKYRITGKTSVDKPPRCTYICTATPAELPLKRRRTS